MGARRAFSPSAESALGRGCRMLALPRQASVCELLSALFRLPRKVAAYGSRKWKPFTACRHFCPWVESLFCFHNGLGRTEPCHLFRSKAVVFAAPCATPCPRQSNLQRIVIARCAAKHMAQPSQQTPQYLRIQSKFQAKNFFLSSLRPRTAGSCFVQSAGRSCSSSEPMRPKS